MNAPQYQRYGLLALRITTGWYFFYAGLSKIVNPDWSAAGYLQHATTFNSFYSWLASPGMLPITNFVNEWGLLLLGLCLIFGIALRKVGVLAAIMMVLYYFPVLDFPKAGEHAWVIDDHLIFAAGLLVISAFSQESPSWLRKFWKR